MFWNFFIKHISYYVLVFVSIYYIILFVYKYFNYVKQVFDLIDSLKNLSIYLKI